MIRLASGLGEVAPGQEAKMPDRQSLSSSNMEMASLLSLDAKDPMKLVCCSFRDLAHLRGVGQLYAG